MPELYTNNPGTTLNGSIISSDTTLVVASATGFPGAGNFRIRIDDEIILVTACSGTSWTVTRGAEGTTAAGHANGVDVNHVLTAGALDAIRTNISKVGTWSGIPSSGMKSGDQYTCTDAPYKAIYDGVSWRYFLQNNLTAGEVFPPALLGSWTWDNQGSSTIDTSHGFFDINFVRSGSVTARSYYRAVSFPKTIVALVQSRAHTFVPGTGDGTDLGWGINVGDGSGKLVTYGQSIYAPSGLAFMWLCKWTSTSSLSSNYSAQSISGPATAHAIANHWLKIEDDNTNLKFSWSINGQVWYQYETRGRTDHLGSGPTRAGIFAYVNSGNVVSTVLSWKES